MAKKKKAVMTAQLNPEYYIKTKARSLEIHLCYINSDWEDSGMASIMVVRRHPKGTFTLGMYLVDTYCLGVKKSFFSFSIDEFQLQDFIDRHTELFHGGWEEIDYNTVHNIIYGAVDYAAELGIKPCKEWSVTQYILEEDDERIPLIDIEFGHNGRPYLSVPTNLEASRYIPILNKTIGEDNYTMLVGNEEDDDFDEEDDDFENYPVASTLFDFYDILSNEKQLLFHTLMLLASQELKHLTPEVKQYANSIKANTEVFEDFDTLQDTFYDMVYSVEDILLETGKKRKDEDKSQATTFLMFAIEICKRIEELTEEQMNDLDSAEKMAKFFEKACEEIYKDLRNFTQL